jgi:hypothetical protein
MKSSSVERPTPTHTTTTLHPHHKPLHPAWRAFIEYCAELKHGEVELLKIQDGLPVIAEVVKKKIKFVP